MQSTAVRTHRLIRRLPRHQLFLCCYQWYVAQPSHPSTLWLSNIKHQLLAALLQSTSAASILHHLEHTSFPTVYRKYPWKPSHGQQLQHIRHWPCQRHFTVTSTSSSTSSSSPSSSTPPWPWSAPTTPTLTATDWNAAQHQPTSPSSPPPPPSWRQPDSTANDIGGRAGGSLRFVLWPHQRSLHYASGRCILSRELFAVHFVFGASDALMFRTERQIVLSGGLWAVSAMDKKANIAGWGDIIFDF